MRQEQVWTSLAARQGGLLTRGQLNALGLDSDHVRRQVRARRWVLRSSVVVGTTTGPLSPRQRLWLGVLHAGPASRLSGLTALEVVGLRRWERSVVEVMVPQPCDVEQIDGVRIRRTRRDLAPLTTTHQGLPLLAVEPAALLAAAYDGSPRAAGGLLAAVVQQRLTTAGRLAPWIDLLRPLRRARLFRSTLADIEGGAQSMAEIDVGRVCRRFGLVPPQRQVVRTDRHGRRRYTDCEWRLPDGRRVVLEVDGAFHLDVEQWESDLARERELVADGATLVRCTSRELRTRPDRIASDLRAVGVPCLGRAGERAV